MSSGRSSAHTPCPAQSIGLTRSCLCLPMSSPVRVVERRLGRQGEEGPAGGAGAVPVRVVVNLGREHLQCAPDEPDCPVRVMAGRSEEHTSELQSRNDISYAVFCLKKKK